MVANSEFKQQLLLREYGRNIKRLVDYVLTIEDREHRSNSAQLLVNLMAQLNPTTVRDMNDAQQKLWNHLYVLAEGKLDVDAPYPLTQMEYLNEKPQKVRYNQKQSRFKHYGQNVEKLIQKASEVEDPEEREAAAISVGKLMKTLYRSYNKDNVTDAIILDNMRELSKGKLTIDLEKVTEKNLFDVNMRAPQHNNNQASQKNYNTANAANQSAYFPNKGNNNNKKNDNKQQRKKQ